MAKLLLTLALLFSIAFALQKPNKAFKGTDDLFDFVLSGDHQIYVLFFYNSKDMQTEGNQELHEHVLHEKQELSETL